MRHLSIFALVFVTFSSPSYSQEEDSSQAKKRATLRKALDESLDEFEVSFGDMQAKPEIVFRWDNKERGATDGFTVIWHVDGRPVILGGVWPDNGVVKHSLEFVGRESGLVATRDEKEVWRPSKDQSRQFVPVPEAPMPAMSENRRRLQMKRLATEFKVEMLGLFNNNSDREMLRLLPTPVHRYGKADTQVLDGAIFLFVKGTDPECGLMLEAVKHGKEYRWEYALVRRTSGALEAHHKDNKTWERPRGYASFADPTKNHVTLMKSLSAGP